MNVTLSIDDRLVIRAREIARRQGSSLNALLRRYLEVLVGDESGEAAAEELCRLMTEQGGRSGGRKFSREEAYEGRLP